MNSISYSPQQIITTTLGHLDTDIQFDIKNFQGLFISLAPRTNSEISKPLFLPHQRYSLIYLDLHHSV